MSRIAFVLCLLVGCGALFAAETSPLFVQIDTTYVFTEDVSLKDARAIALQRTREAALNKALPLEIAITTLTTDMYVERNQSFDEATARSIFMMSSSAGRFCEEKLLRSDPVFDRKSGTYRYEISYRAKILPVPKYYNSALDMQVELSNTLLKDGEKFELEVSTNQDGYLYIFDFLSDNSVILVYPNLTVRSNTLNKGKPWRLDLTAVADPSRSMTIETLYLVYSTEPISGWESFRANTGTQDLVFSAGDESFILFQQWLARSDPNLRVEKMAQLHIMKD